MKELKITDVRVVPGDSGFLIDDGTTSILYDSGFAFTGYKLADNIKNALGKRELDYIFLTHSHYDHAAGSAYVKKVFPGAKVVAGAGSVKSSAGTYTACTDVMDPLFVEVIRSCIWPISVASVGW